MRCCAVLPGSLALAAVVLAGCDRPPEPAPEPVAAAPGESSGRADPRNERSEAREREMAAALQGLRFVDGRVEAEPTGTNDPNLARALARYGDELLQIDHSVKAIAAFAEAVRHRPEFAQGYFGLGRALVGKGRLDQASAALRTAIERDPDFSDARFSLALNEARRQRLDVAIVEMSGLVEREPDRADAHERIAIWRYYRGELAESRRHAEQAEALGHRMPPQFIDQLERAERESGGTP